MIMQDVAANVVLMFVSIVIVAHGTQIEGQDEVENAKLATPEQIEAWKLINENC